MISNLKSLPVGLHAATYFAEKTVDKVWGTEYWLVNTAQYCAKILHLEPGMACSLHWHREKIETFICLQGVVRLELPDTQVWLAPGEKYHISCGMEHRFSSKDGAVILEVSTFHSDSDVVRIEESKRL